MDTLDGELIRKILLRVPAISVIRCRLVCRLWQDLTSDHDFIRDQMDRTMMATPGIMHLTNVSDDSSEFHSSFSLINLSINAPTPTYFSVPLSIPNVMEFILCSSCNGLLLLLLNQNLHFQGNACIPTNHSHQSLYICNPLLRKFIMLPTHELNTTGESHIFTFRDFGFCPQIQSYKVLEVSVWLDNANGGSCVENYVYRLGDRFWNRIDTDTLIITMRSDTTCIINGAFHWIHEFWGATLTVFDLEHDTFSEMRGPIHDRKSEGTFSNGVIGNYLSVINTHDNILDVWLMKEYRVSWEKYFTLNLIRMVEMNLERHSFHYMIEGEHELFLLHPNYILAYNIEENRFKFIEKLYHGCYVCPHFETLLSPLELQENGM